MALIETDRLQTLRAAADDARRLNYAPYSRILVLAAAELDGGAVEGASNVESANFTLTKHAEELAVIAAFRAADVKPARDALRCVYVAGPPPCGSCRQFVSEFGSPDALWVIEPVDQGDIQTRQLVDRPTDVPLTVIRFDQALPLTFGQADLSPAPTQ